MQLWPTSAVLVIRLTLASCTPGVPFRAASTAVLQEAHVMPPMLSRIVDASPLPSSVASNPAPSTVLSSSSCSSGCDVRTSWLQDDTAPKSTRIASCP